MTYASPTTINATKGLGEVLNYANSVTNNWLSNMFLLGIYIIILMGFYKARDDFKGAMAVAGYGTFVVGLFFWIGGFVSGMVFGVAVALAIVGTLMLLLDNNWCYPSYPHIFKEKSVYNIKDLYRSFERRI